MITLGTFLPFLSNPREPYFSCAPAHQSWYLVAETFATTCGHHEEDITLGQNGVDSLQLVGSEPSLIAEREPANLAVSLNKDSKALNRLVPASDFIIPGKGTTPISRIDGRRTGVSQ